MLPAITAEQFAQIVDRSHRGACERGFWDQERNFGEMVALVHSEISEAVEGLETPRADDHVLQYSNWQVEFADMYIRAADMLGGFAAKYQPVGELLKLEVQALRPAEIVSRLAATTAYAAHQPDSWAEIELLLEARYLIPPKQDVYSLPAHYDFVADRLFQDLEDMTQDWLMLQLHRVLSHILEGHRGEATSSLDGSIALDLMVFMATVDAAYRAIVASRMPFYDVIDAKLNYNKSRPYKHGKKF